MNTNMPRAIGEGRPNRAVATDITNPAIKATEIWLPTNAPILETMPLVNARMRSRRVAGAKRIP